MNSEHCTLTYSEDSGLAVGKNITGSKFYDYILQVYALMATL